MSDRACALCGRDPSAGHANVTEGDRVLWLCHDLPPEPPHRSCYVRWTVYGERPETMEGSPLSGWWKSHVARHVVAALRALPGGWNGHGAEPVTPAALAVAEALQVIPRANGGIQIEWHANGQDVEIAVEPDGTVDAEDGVLVALCLEGS